MEILKKIINGIMFAYVVLNLNYYEKARQRMNLPPFHPADNQNLLPTTFPRPTFDEFSFLKITFVFGRKGF